MSRFCQSCGMPMKQDPRGGGTNADGTVNRDLCSYCYRDGAFTQPDLTAAEMQTFCIDRLREQGVPRPVGWLMTRNIPRLKRWAG